MRTTYAQETESEATMSRPKYALVYTDYISDYIDVIHNELTNTHDRVLQFLSENSRIPYPIVAVSSGDGVANISRINECALTHVWLNRHQIPDAEWEIVADIYAGIPKASVPTNKGTTYTYYSEETHEIGLKVGLMLSNLPIVIPHVINRGKPSLKIASTFSILHTGRFILGQSIQKSS